MKGFQTVPVYFVVLALVAAVPLKSDPLPQVQGKAIVRAIHGNAIQTMGAVSKPLTVNMELAPGTAIITSADSSVWLAVNGWSSAVCVRADTKLSLDLMDRNGSAPDGDTITMLAIKTGSIFSQVKRLPAHSRYEITTPHGVAGIRGATDEADFAITINEEPDRKTLPTFTSVKGSIDVSSVVTGNMQTKTLNEGETWTPPLDDPHPAPHEMIVEFRKLIVDSPK
jgi:hypothetical protein